MCEEKRNFFCDSWVAGWFFTNKKIEINEIMFKELIIFFSISYSEWDIDLKFALQLHTPLTYPKKKVLNISLPQ